MSTLSNYQSSAAYKAAQGYENATLDSIAKKYGLNFSKSYAQQQADTEANAQKIAQQAASRENNSSNHLTLQKITNDYRDSAKSLDKGYFQQYLNTQQSQTNRGLSGGLASAQDVQLALGKQSELGGLWRTRNQATAEEMSRFNNTKQQIADALSQIEKERSLNTQKYYQNGLDRGLSVLSSERNYGLSLDNNSWSKYLAGAQFDQQLKAYADAQAQAAADRAARARAASYSRSRSRSGSSGGGGGTSVAKTALSNALDNYNAAKKKQSQTPIEKYVGAFNTMENWRKTLSPTVSRMVAQNSSSPASTPYLSPWEKMKMLGL